MPSRSIPSPNLVNLSDGATREAGASDTTAFVHEPEEGGIAELNKTLGAEATLVCFTKTVTGLVCLLVSLALFEMPSTASAASPQARAVRVVALGDSITKGVRPGVSPEETVSSLMQVKLKAAGIDAEIVNLGIGGERTDQALKRLDAVGELRPQIVTVMYGTNDSYVDSGASASRISRKDYKANLKSIVADLQLRGIKPILMTEPRWSDKAPVNGLGENPNLRLAPYMEACREVASECHVPLIDHFALWTKARDGGQDLNEWTTDGCHPNPRGHRELAEAMWPTLRAGLRTPQSIPVPSSVSNNSQPSIQRSDGLLDDQTQINPRPDRQRIVLLDKFARSQRQGGQRRIFSCSKQSLYLLRKCRPRGALHLKSAEVINGREVICNY